MDLSTLPTGALVLNATFPCTLKTPAFGQSQPYIADSPAKAAYVDAMETELEALDEELRTRPIRAVRLSGGASIMSADKTCHLVRRIRKTLAVEPRAQISIDVDPLTVGTPSLTDWTSCGINRVNLRVWSVIDEELAALGASHRREHIQNALLFLEKFHLNDVSAELLFGLPGQTLASWKQSVRTLAELACPHVRVLPLVETRAEKASQLPDAETRRAMYEAAHGVLSGKGYLEYLPGMFVRKDAPHARDAFEVALRGGAGLLGLGAGVRSSYDGFLFENTGDFDRYVKNAADFEAVVVNPRREGADAMQARVAQGMLDATGPLASAVGGTDETSAASDIGSDGGHAGAGAIAGDAASRERSTGAEAAGFTAGELACACGLGDGANALAPQAVAWLDALVTRGLASRDAASGRYALTSAGRMARLEELGAALAL